MLQAPSQTLLSDARWFTRQEVEAVLNHKSGTRFGRSDYKKMNEITDGPTQDAKDAKDAKDTKDITKLDAAAQALTPLDPTKPKPHPMPEDDGQPPFRLPPTSAIAGVLIRDWIDRKIGFPVEEVIQKGNL